MAAHRQNLPPLVPLGLLLGCLFFVLGNRDQESPETSIEASTKNPVASSSLTKIPNLPKTEREQQLERVFVTTSEQGFLAGLSQLGSEIGVAKTDREALTSWRVLASALSDREKDQLLGLISADVPSLLSDAVIMATILSAPESLIPTGRRKRFFDYIQEGERKTALQAISEGQTETPPNNLAEDLLQLVNLAADKDLEGFLALSKSVASPPDAALIDLASRSKRLAKAAVEPIPLQSNAAGACTACEVGFPGRCLLHQIRRNQLKQPF